MIALISCAFVQQLVCNRVRSSSDGITIHQMNIIAAEACQLPENTNY